MRIIICDDEAEYLNDIEKHVNQYLFEHGLFAEIYKYLGSKEALENIDYFDIAFLDIEMNGENGLQIGKKLQRINPDIVLIYVTAYEHYLDEAFDLGSIRFFDKPIDSQRFYKGFEKAIDKLDNSEVTFYVQDDENGTVSIRISDIIYVEIKGRKTKVITKDKFYYSKENIKSWRLKLNKTCFISPHNSFIVNTNYITYFQKDHIILNGRYYVPIAYANRVEFKRKFMMALEDS